MKSELTKEQMPHEMSRLRAEYEQVRRKTRELVLVGEQRGGPSVYAN
jgi:hypothetical protein